MSLANALLTYARTSGRSGVNPILEALAQSRMRSTRSPVSREPAPMSGEGPNPASGPVYGSSLSRGMLTLPTRWKGTHDTGGADWNDNARTAEDIMARAGTWVGAPEAGHVVYYHPTGAQGGGSLLFDPDAPGGNYWLGHITGSAPIGKRLRRGQRLTRVSADHPAPHVHIDRIVK